MRVMFQLVCGAAIALLTIGSAPDAFAQPAQESPWVIDVGIGIDTSLNGNVNSGAIGTFQGLATAVLPQPYGDVYGSGVNLRFGGGYRLDDLSELRGMFTYQSADADLVRLGDIGPSSLYAQYTDYKSLGLEFGYRRYVPLAVRNLRVYGEAAIGAAFIDNISAEFAAPQAGVIFSTTDFYDQSAALTLGFNAGVLFPIADQIDINAQVGLRHVSGLSEVDQLLGTGLEDLNSDSARLTMPFVVGVRFRFR